MSKGGGSRTVTSSSRILPEYERFANENLTLAGTIANQPFVPFQGQRLADVSQDELDAAQFIRAMPGRFGGLGGGIARRVDQAEAPMISVGDITANTEAFMNPYTSQVIDTTLADLDRANQMALNRVGTAAVGAGSFGGSRQGIAEAETNRAFADQAARTAAQLRATGFNQAQSAAQDLAMRNQASQAAQLGRQLQAADALRRASLGKAERDLAFAQAQQNLGLGIRDREQQALDLAYGDFLEQRGFPLRQLAIRQSGLSGTPVGQLAQIPVRRSPLNFGSFLGGFGSLLQGASALGAV